MPIQKPSPALLNWEVDTQKLYNKDHKALKDYRLLVRSDNGGLLNVCKKTYTPTTNERFKEVVDRMADVTGFGFEGYVEVKGGRSVFAYLKSEKQKMAGFDIDNYMVIGNSHDYSSGFFISTVHNMIRCQNQWAKVKKGSLYTIQHTSQSDVKIDELMRRFETYMDDLRKTSRELELWKEIEVDQTLREMMIQRILNIELGLEESMPSRTRNRVELLNSSLDREMADIGDNMLGLYQGVTHYTTHVLGQKEQAFGNLMGSAHEINNKAYAFCSSMAAGSIDQMEFHIN